MFTIIKHTIFALQVVDPSKCMVVLSTDLDQLTSASPDDPSAVWSAFFDSSPSGERSNVGYTQMADHIILDPPARGAIAGISTFQFECISPSP